MTLAENLADLERHRAEFEERAAFAYTVLDTDEHAVVGCVYVEPDPALANGALLRTWVTTSRAELDGQLREGVLAWLERDWPLASVSLPAA